MCKCEEKKLTTEDLITLKSAAEIRDKAAALDKQSKSLKKSASNIALDVLQRNNVQKYKLKLGTFFLNEGKAYTDQNAVKEYLLKEGVDIDLIERAWAECTKKSAPYLNWRTAPKKED